MKISVKVADAAKSEKTCAVIGVYEDQTLTNAGNVIDKASQGELKKRLKQGIFQGKIGQTLPLFHLSHDAVLLIGCGKNKPLTPNNFRQITTFAFNFLRDANLPQVLSFLTELEVDGHSLAWKVKQLSETILTGPYRFDVFKSKKQPFTLKECVIAIDDKKALKACELALTQGLAIGKGCNFARDLANSPSNICTPTYLAEQAKRLAKQFQSIKLTILEEKDMAKLGMGALLGVAQGSKEKPKLITLEYYGASKKQAPIALVGKGITFDTGGISLKSHDGMVGMKYDMSGAAAVLGTLQAVADLKLPINVVGVVPAAENMPGGGAYKPEDILTSMSGQTIEIISTDAEGRLILCDALTYCERFKPQAVIDIATLTGAVVIALGSHATGMVTNDQPLAQALKQAGEESADRVWELPLWDEYQEQIASPFADVANLGDRMAGAITAGCFLSRFTNSFKWAHLDVAGTAAMMTGVSQRRATGRPVPLLMQYLIQQANQSLWI